MAGQCGEVVRVLVIEGVQHRHLVCHHTHCVCLLEVGESQVCLRVTVQPSQGASTVLTNIELLKLTKSNKERKREREKRGKEEYETERDGEREEKEREKDSSCFSLTFNQFVAFLL